MRLSFSWHAIAKVPPRAYAFRFAFGGAVTVATGLVAHWFGPAAGGLFLAFPALLPASLTLVKERDGRAAAVDDATGACLGSIGTFAFACVGRAMTDARPVAVLAAAVATWLGVAIALWMFCFARRA